MLNEVKEVFQGFIVLPRLLALLRRGVEASERAAVALEGLQQQFAPDTLPHSEEEQQVEVLQQSDEELAAIEALEDRLREKHGTADLGEEAFKDAVRFLAKDSAVYKKVLERLG